MHQVAKESDIEIHLTNMSGTEPTKKLPVSEFDIDETTNVINKCPARHTTVHSRVKSGQTTAHFSHDDCAGCELKDQCYSKKQVKTCVVRINLKAVETSREREKMKACKKENTSKRAGTKAVILLRNVKASISFVSGKRPKALWYAPLKSQPKTSSELSNTSKEGTNQKPII